LSLNFDDHDSKDQASFAIPPWTESLVRFLSRDHALHMT
jgi:hypothetical protein